MGFFDRIKQSLSRTTQQFVDKFEDVVRRADAPEQRSRPVDVETIDALEEALISADVGVAATDRIVEAVRTRDRRSSSLRFASRAEASREAARLARRPSRGDARERVRRNS